MIGKKKYKVKEEEELVENGTPATGFLVGFIGLLIIGFSYFLCITFSLWFGLISIIGVVLILFVGSGFFSDKYEKRYIVEEMKK